jgi:CheY-like chemotaxis protein
MTGGIGAHKLRVFVVEDNPGDVQLLEMALQSAQLACELTVIDDGAEALAFVRQQGKYAGTTPPDLAILDLNLPKCDGIEILRGMRDNKSFANVPVAILTSSSSPREVARMEGLQIARYITKPMDFDEYLKIGVILKELLSDADRLGAAGKTSAT